MSGNDTEQNVQDRSVRGRGSALVMAIVTVMLLFIIGMSFFVTNRTYKQTVSGTASEGALDDAVDAVVNQINTVLVDDLFGNDEYMLNGEGDGDGDGNPTGAKGTPR